MSSNKCPRLRGGFSFVQTEVDVLVWSWWRERSRYSRRLRSVVLHSERELIFKLLDWPGQGFSAILQCSRDNLAVANGDRMNPKPKVGTVVSRLGFGVWRGIKGFEETWSSVARCSALLRSNILQTSPIWRAFGVYDVSHERWTLNLILSVGTLFCYRAVCGCWYWLRAEY